MCDERVLLTEPRDRDGIRVPRIVVLAVFAALAIGALYAVARLRAPAAVPIAVVEDPPTATPVPLVVVDVGGAVARPGVVRLSYGTRVGDAIAAAGGPAPDADLAAINRAALLRDGSRVYVPHFGETPPAGSLGSETAGQLIFVTSQRHPIAVMYDPSWVAQPDFQPLRSAEEVKAAETAGRLLPFNKDGANPFEMPQNTVVTIDLQTYSR